MSVQQQMIDKNLNIPLGISNAIGEILLMVAMTAMVKLISSEVSVITILLFRYALCLPLLVGVAIWQNGRRALVITRYPILIARMIFGLISLTCFYAAIGLITLAQVTTLFQTITLFVTFLAPILLAEAVGWRRWTAVVVGFCGTVMVISPDTTNWSLLGIMLGLSAPFFGALMLVMLRKLGQTENPASAAIWYNGFGALVFLTLFLIRGESLLFEGRTLLILLIIGLFAGFQQLCLAYSHRLAPASLLAPFRYLSIPFGIMVGLLFFDEDLSANVAIGSVVIVVSSLFILQREKVLQAKA